jgi:hypothetical protein
MTGSRGGGGRVAVASQAAQQGGADRIQGI